MRLVTVLWTFDGAPVRRVGANRTRPCPNRLTALPAPRSPLFVPLVAACFLSLSLPLPLPGSGLRGRLCVLRGSGARRRCGRGGLRDRAGARPVPAAACKQVRAGKGEEHGRGQRDPRGQDAETCRPAGSRSVVAGRRDPRAVGRAAARRRPEVGRSRPPGSPRPPRPTRPPHRQVPGSATTAVTAFGSTGAPSAASASRSAMASGYRSAGSVAIAWAMTEAR